MVEGPCYDYPDSEMTFLKRLAKAPGNRIRNLVGRYFIDSELVEGTLKESQRRLRLLYSGDARFRAYFYGLVFDGPPIIVHRARVSMGGLTNVFGQPDFDVGVALIPHRNEPPLRGLYTYRGTQSVRQAVDISSPWEEIVNQFSNKIVRTPRRIRQYGLSYRITNNQADLDLFYQHMYLPHVRKFGSSVVVDSCDDMKSWFGQGFLLLVLEGGSPIAGGLCMAETTGQTLVFQKIGVLNGDHENLRKGAQAATYYFVLQHAKESGFRKVSFGYSPAFLNDGIFQHKAGWGAQASPYEKAKGSLLYFFPSDNPITLAFLAKNPVVVSAEDGTLQAVTGWTGSPEELTTAKTEIVRSYPTLGIRRFIIHSEAGHHVVEAQEACASS